MSPRPQPAEYIAFRKQDPHLVEQIDAARNRRQETLKVLA